MENEKEGHGTVHASSSSGMRSGPPSVASMSRNGGTFKNDPNIVPMLKDKMKSWRNTQNYCKQLQTGVNEYERERERERERRFYYIFLKNTKYHIKK